MKVGSGNGVKGSVSGELPLSPDDVARALRPLEHASMLPPAAFVDQAVFEWEQKHLFHDGWICPGHISQVSEQGKFIRREVGPDSVVVIGGVIVSTFFTLYLIPCVYLVLSPLERRHSLMDELAEEDMAPVHGSTETLVQR